MAASRYRLLVQCLERWPVEKSKGNRDLGVLIRKKVAEAFPQGEASSINTEECDKMLESVQRLLNDVHRKKWERQRQTNASGSNSDELKTFLSDQSLKELSDESMKPLLKRLKERILPST